MRSWSCSVGHQPQPDQIVEWFGDVHEPKRGEPERARRVAVGAVRREQRRGRRARSAVRPRRRRARRRRPRGGGQHVEEAVVGEAGLRVVVADGVVQPGGALERQSPGPGRRRSTRPARSGSGTARGRARRCGTWPRARRPATLVGGGAASAPVSPTDAASSAWTGVVVERPRAGVVDRCTSRRALPARSSGSRNAISSAGDARPPPAAAQRRRATCPAPPVTPTRRRGRATGRAASGSVGVAAGRRGRPGRRTRRRGARGGRPWRRASGAAGREDGGVVDEAAKRGHCVDTDSTGRTRNGQQPRLSDTRPVNGQQEATMAVLPSVGEVPRKRHTQFRDARRAASTPRS